MPGKVKNLIDEVIRIRTKGNPGLTHFVRAHLIVKGIHPDAYTEASQDDEEVVRQLEKMLEDFRR